VIETFDSGTTSAGDLSSAGDGPKIYADQPARGETSLALLAGPIIIFLLGSDSSPASYCAPSTHLPAIAVIWGQCHWRESV
jgi:hypothetical protein